jgi:Fe2+ or Zn2+ uptake regulation protein
MYNDERQDRGRTSAREKERARLHPIRMAILNLLSGRKRELPARALCHELPDSPSLSLVAYHLKVLLDAGLVKANRNDPAAPAYFLPTLVSPADSGH